MRRRLTCIIVTVISFAAFNLVGCKKNEKGAGDTGVTGPVMGTGAGKVGGAGSGITGPGGTGNTDTTTGAGAVNGVSGNETSNAIAAPGNTAAGRGITTRPSTAPSQ